MVPCPACAKVAFHDGRCRACGFAIVAGRPAADDASRPASPAAPAPPPSLPPDALRPIEEDGPSLPGFESTQLDDPQTYDPAPDPGGLRYQACPRCRTALPDPNPTFCDGCGIRLKTRARRVAAIDDDTQRCRDCGVENPSDRTSCINCGFRLTGSD